MNNFQNRRGNNNQHSSVGLHGQRNESMRQVLKSGCGIVLLMSPADSLYTCRLISVLSPMELIAPCSHLSTNYILPRHTRTHCYIIDLYHADCNKVGTTMSNDIHVFMTAYITRICSLGLLPWHRCPFTEKQAW